MSRTRAEIYGQHDRKSLDGRGQLWDDNIDLAQRCQPINNAKSSSNYHRSNALQKTMMPYMTLVTTEVT